MRINLDIKGIYLIFLFWYVFSAIYPWLDIFGSKLINFAVYLLLFLVLMPFLLNHYDMILWQIYHGDRNRDYKFWQAKMAINWLRRRPRDFFMGTVVSNMEQIIAVKRSHDIMLIFFGCAVLLLIYNLVLA